MIQSAATLLTPHGAFVMYKGVYNISCRIASNYVVALSTYIHLFLLGCAEIRSESLPCNPVASTLLIIINHILLILAAVVVQ